jgi:hypothetical protein
MMANKYIRRNSVNDAKGATHDVLVGIGCDSASHDSRKVLLPLSNIPIICG